MAVNPTKEPQGVSDMGSDEDPLARGLQRCPYCADYYSGGHSCGNNEFTEPGVSDRELTEEEYNYPDTAEFKAKAYLCNVKYDGAGRMCAYRHRHRYRVAAWLCGRWQAILRYIP